MLGLLKQKDPSGHPPIPTAPRYVRPMARSSEMWDGGEDPQLPWTTRPYIPSTATSLCQQVPRRLLHNNPAGAGTGVDARSLLTTTVLNFEGVGNDVPIGGYYSGVGGGPDHGVVFGPAAYTFVDADAGGSGNTANEPSGEATMFFKDVSDAYITVAAGFTGMSFQYSSFVPGTVTVHGGPDGSGLVLASAPLPRTGVCEVEFPACGDPAGAFGRWFLFTVPLFGGVARSVRFTGQYLEWSAYFDDLTIFGGDPHCTQTTYWLWDPATDAAVGELKNNTATCFPAPYNIEARPCSAPATVPVTMVLRNAALTKIRTQKEHAAPFFFWGDDPATGDVFKSALPLAAGTYWLSTKIDGVEERIRFTKTC
jgi:hypothetical protein